MKPNDRLGLPLRFERGLFWVVLAGAATVRLIGLFSHATMPDEAFTFFIAAHPLPQIVQLLKTGDFHPPLIYVVGHALFALTNKGYLFRLLSAFAGVVGVAATYVVARRVLGSWALLVAFLVAFNPSLVFYDGFFRMYALLWSSCMLSWALLLWAADAPKRFARWAAYAACLTVLLYTQYLAFFTLAAQIGYAVLSRRAKPGFWAAVLASLALFSPWVPVLLVQYPLGGTAYNALHGHWADMLQAPAVLLIDGLPSVIELSLIVMALLWAGIAAGAILAVAQRRWLIVALMTPALLQVCYSLLSGKLLLGQRYLLQAIPVLVILLVLVIQAVASSRARFAALGAATALMSLTVAGTVDKRFVGSYMPVDWTVYRSFLESRMRPGDAIIFDSSMVYYVLVGSQVARDRPLFLVTDPDDAAAYGAQAAKFPRVWLVDYQSQLPDPKALAYAALASSHPIHTTWRSTQAGYGDVVVTTLFERRTGKRGP
jgi:mannosyltransferase